MGVLEGGGGALVFSLAGAGWARFRGKGGEMAKGVRGFLEIPKGADLSMELMEEVALFAEENPGAVLYAPEKVWQGLLEETLVMAKGGHPLALRLLGALEKIAFRAIPGGSAWEVLEA